MPVHLRVNDKDTSRNPFINFITALPGPRHDEALRRLQQLAAMVKPLMRDQGFHINSLEEYEWNREFAGRCWNNGEAVELVLTSAKGEWMPLQYVLFVFCHELAHIKHMNHIPKLHGALTKQLKEEALERQRRGYYGDGLWSAGRQLENGIWKAGLGMNQSTEILPEHVCGGAFMRTRRGSSSRRRRAKRGTSGGGRKFKGPSLHTGAQTAPNTRGGNRRVQLDKTTTAQGSRVDGRNWIPTASAKDSSYKLDENSTFRKRTQTYDARQLRANAALARFAGLKAEQPQTAEMERKPSSEAMEAKGTSLILGQPVKSHKQGLRAAFERQASGVSHLSSSQATSAQQSESEDHEDANDQNSDTASESSEDDVDLRDAEADFGDDLQPSTQGWGETSEKRLKRIQKFQSAQDDGHALIDSQEEWRLLLQDDPERTGRPKAQRGPSKEKRTARRTLISDHDDEEEKEDVVLVEEMPSKRIKSNSSPVATARQSLDWECLVCTLLNKSSRLRCEVCETSRGQTVLAI